MTAKVCAPVSDDTDPNAKPGRTEIGRFDDGNAGGPGNPRGRGRPRGQSLAAELRRQADTEAMATWLIGVINNPAVSWRDRVDAFKEFSNRTEGKSIGRSVVMSADRLLPVGFDRLDPEQKRAVLVELRERALTGSLDVLGVGAGDNE